MQLPIDEKLRTKVQEYLRSQKGDPGFAVLLDWIKGELQKRDQENRHVGGENKTSEAKGFADFLYIVAACQAPVTDRENEEGEESKTSAQILM